MSVGQIMDRAVYGKAIPSAIGVVFPQGFYFSQGLRTIHNNLIYVIDDLSL